MERQSSDIAFKGGKSKGKDKEFTGNPLVQIIYLNWQSSKDFHSRRLKRCIENWRFYAALDNDIGLGQWPAEAVASLISQNRQILTYNFIMPIVDQIAGGMCQSIFDPEFYPVNTKVTSLTEAIKTALYTDKDLMSWDQSYLEVVRAGLVSEGVLKGVISTEYDELGNIGFESCLPGSVIPDPAWRTSRSKDCDFCYHEQWFQPQKILQMWGDKVPMLQSEVNRVIHGGEQYGSDLGVTPYGDNDTWGTAYRVISEYKMIDSQYKQEYAISADGPVDIPRDLKETEEKIRWLNENVQDWSPERICERQVKERKCRVRRICPSLSWNTLLEDAWTEWQTGALPFFWWSAARINGEPHSIVDLIKDTQISINYNESLITLKQQVEGEGGSQFVDPDGFKNEDELARYRTNHNDPTETFLTRDGLITQSGRSPAMPVAKSVFPREAYERLNHIVQVLLPHVSKVTPTSRGLQEGSGESGTLYQQMTQQSDKGLYTMYFSYKQFWAEIYGAYLIQAANTYSNEQIPRTFTKLSQSGESVTLNEPVDLGDGRKGVKNDASQLKNIRHKVVVSESQQSPTRKMEMLKLITEYMKSLPQTMAPTITFLAKKVGDLLDGLEEEDKEMMEQLGNVELEAAIAAVQMQTAQAKLQAKQANDALNNPPQVPGQQPGPPAQGAPQPQGGPPPQQPQQSPPDAPQSAGQLSPQANNPIQPPQGAGQ